MFNSALEQYFPNTHWQLQRDAHHNALRLTVACRAHGAIVLDEKSVYDAYNSAHLVMDQAQHLYYEMHGRRGSLSPRHVCESCQHITWPVELAKMGKTELYEYAIITAEHWMELASEMKP